MLHKRTHDRTLRSPNYNFNFEYATGKFMRWGSTLKHDPEFSPYGPEIVDIEISEICHKGCSFCYKSNTAQGKWMPFETFKVIFDKLPKTVTQIAFGTGTLSSNPDTWKIMKYCREHFVVPNITINGHMMSTSEFDSLAKYCGAVAVSHYNDTECFDAVCLLTLRGMKQVNIHKLVSQETFQSCLDLIKKVKIDGRLAKLNCIVFLMMKPKGKRNVLHGLTGIQQYQQLINLAFKEGVGIGFDSCSAPSFLQAVQGHPEYERFEQCADPCESTCFSYYINVEGVGYPCSFTEDQPQYKGIDVKKAKSFMKDVWNGAETQAFRKRLLTNVDCNRCRNCPEFNLKLGGAS